MDKYHILVNRWCYHACNRVHGGVLNMRVSKTSKPVPGEEKLVEDNLSLVHFLIQKRKSTLLEWAEYDDLVQLGSIGLLHAARIYDSSKGYKFSTLVNKCVETVLQKFIRDQKAAKRGYGIAVASLDELFHENLTLGDVVSQNETGFEQAENVVLLRDLIKTLDAKERKVISGRFMDLTQADISKEMGVAQSWIARIEKNAYKKMRQEVGCLRDCMC